MSESDNQGDDLYLELLGKIVETIKSHGSISEQTNSLMNSLKSKLDDLNEVMESNTAVIGGNNEIVKSFSDLVKGFSIYAANREEADEHLSKSMKLLGEMWNKSIEMFGETRDIVAQIAKYAERLNEGNLLIMENIDGNEIKEINILQENFVKGLIELVRTLSRGFTSEQIKAYIIEIIRKTAIGDKTKLPQYLEYDDRLEWSQKQAIVIANRFGVTDFGISLMKFYHFTFLTTLSGKKFADHPYFGEHLQSFKDFEDKVYD